MRFFNRLARKVRLWMRQGLSRALARLYDGPTAPDRLQGFVFEYVRFYPHATRAEWMTFCLRLGDELYRSGYERGREAGMAEARAVQVVDDERFNWEWNVDVPRFSPAFMREHVPDEDPPNEQGFTEEERAMRHHWRQLYDRDRMAQNSGR